MRIPSVGVLAATLSLALPAHATESSELAQIREQLQQMKIAYEQRIAALEERLAQTEKTAGQAVRQNEAGAARVSPGSFNPEISLSLQGQYKKMKDIPQRGLTGFWPIAGHDPEHGAAAAGKRGFSLDHSELAFSANVDPFWRGQLLLGLQDGEAEVEEAWIQSTGLGHGIGLKAGRLRSGMGYLNEQHAHAWDFADAPLVYKALFGEHASYAQDGVQIKWLAPGETFLEFGAEFGRGAAFPGTDRNRNGNGSSTLFAHLGGDLGASHSWRGGFSWLHTAAKAREASFEDINGLAAQGVFDGKSRTLGADFVWKWSPNGNPRERNFKLQGEYFIRQEQGVLTCRDENALGNACADPVASDYRTRQTGWYLQGVYQFAPAWRAGMRYDRLDSGHRDFGINADNLRVASYRPGRSTLMADYRWSEFSRLRLQWAADKSMQGVTDRQITLQYIVNLGAHGAHKF